MDIIKNEPTGRPSTPDPRCSICLNELTNKCYTNACVHLFCFDCLQYWSNVCLEQCSVSEPTCPLCKETFRYIYHSFDYSGVFETYTVPILETLPNLIPRIFVRPFSQISNGNSMFSGIQSLLNIDLGNQTPMSTQRGVFGSDEVDYNHDRFYHLTSPDYPRPTFHRPIDGQAMRIQVYADNVWAEPLPDTGNFINGTSAFYRDNPIEIHRLYEFILRDLVAIRESVRTEGQPMLFPDNTDMTVTVIIMQSMAVYEIGQLHLLNIFRPFLDAHVAHFCHELYNFANSAFDISNYDRNVQYTYPPYDNELTALFYQEQPPPIYIVGETIVLDSDDEEFQWPNIIEISSSTDDSDVESSTDLLNSSSFDQPSTSSGIQYSLDRLNNSFQFAYGDLSPVPFSSQVKRGSSNIDSSSSDEESIIATRGFQNAHLESRNVSNKKKNKQRRFTGRKQ